MSRTWSQIAISLTRCLSCFGGIWCYITLTNKNINFARVSAWFMFRKKKCLERNKTFLSTAVMSTVFLSKLPVLRPLDLPLTSWFRNCNWTLNFRLWWLQYHKKLHQVDRAILTLSTSQVFSFDLLTCTAILFVNTYSNKTHDPISHKKFTYQGRYFWPKLVSEAISEHMSKIP